MHVQQPGEVMEPRLPVPMVQFHLLLPMLMLCLLLPWIVVRVVMPWVVVPISSLVDRDVFACPRMFPRSVSLTVGQFPGLVPAQLAHRRLAPRTAAPDETNPRGHHRLALVVAELDLELVWCPLCLLVLGIVAIVLLCVSRFCCSVVGTGS